MAAQTKRRSLFDAPVLDTRIHSANTQKSEGWLGYFFGPCFISMVYYAVAGSYLTQFYTDVLGLAGGFLTLMPFFSKIVDAITNIVMGRIIDRTRTKQGKARPWILLSGILIAMAGVMLYAVPKADVKVQLVWIVVSYNLFFAFAYTIYNMSHNLMVPLSTRNTKQRDKLAMLTSTGTSMIPGLLVTIIMPIMINSFGVGEQAQGTWFKMMSIISILAVPATLLEYYFTRERVTEDAMAAEKGVTRTISFVQQFKACFTDKYWLLVLAFNLMFQVINYLSTNSMLYYSNWVMSDSVAGGTAKQVLINAIGQAPLGLGIFVLWPLVGKFGKRRVIQVGFVIGAIGSLVVLFNPGSFGIVLAGLFIKSIGALPTYCMAALTAEAMDHIEWKNGYRADGFSAAVFSIIMTVSSGIGQSILLGGISAFGYIAPVSNTQVIEQPTAMKLFFSVCFVGVTALGYLLGALIMSFYDVEKNMPQISADITARHKAEAEARGEVYLSMEERAAIEEAEQENRPRQNASRN